MDVLPRAAAGGAAIRDRGYGGAGRGDASGGCAAGAEKTEGASCRLAAFVCPGSFVPPCLVLRAIPGNVDRADNATRVRALHPAACGVSGLPVRPAATSSCRISRGPSRLRPFSAPVQLRREREAQSLVNFGKGTGKTITTMEARRCILLAAAESNHVPPRHLALSLLGITRLN